MFKSREKTNLGFQMSISYGYTLFIAHTFWSFRLGFQKQRQIGQDQTSSEAEKGGNGGKEMGNAL
jgi:hypothetical protein